MNTVTTILTNNEKVVLFKLRRQVAEDPYRVFWKLYASFITEIDRTIAHGNDHLYSIAWAPVMDAMPFWLLDSLYVQPGLLRIEHTDDEHHLARMSIQPTLARHPRAREEIDGFCSLYGLEASRYVREIVLRPLAGVISTEGTLPPDDEMRREVAASLSDLLEAFPYLLSSKRYAKYLIDVPGTSCVAAFNFAVRYGFAAIYIADSRESFVRDMEVGSCRGVLEIGYDGRMNCYMHPWLTLERMFGPDTSLKLTFWLLKQFHHRVVADYLKIQNYYLDPQRMSQAEADQPEADQPEEMIAANQNEFRTWVQEVRDVALACDNAEEESASGDKAGPLPQMRRSRFFKILGLCGVSVEQGKGSELKILRPNTHPFRLGNHYGPNPTIPSFLIVSILKRLEITQEQWREAVACVMRRSVAES